MLKSEIEVILVSRSDVEGGAAKAAFRLLQALKIRFKNVSLVADLKKSKDPNVLTSSSYFYKIFVRIKPRLDILPIQILYQTKLDETWGLGWLPFFSQILKIAKQKPDAILHLHWISFGSVPLYSFWKLKNRRIFWTMHDMWALTGGCHYSGDCDNFKIGCGRCPQLNSKIKYDLSRFFFWLKRKIFSSMNVTVICCSEWLKECFEQSPVFKNKKIVCMPNPIDTDLFSPVSEKEARKKLNLPVDKKLILLSAMSAVSNKRKGFQFLPKCMNLLSEKFQQNIALVVLGAETSEGIANDFHAPVFFLGTVSDEQTLVLAYNACDVAVAPSLQENLSNSVMESLSCGTPVVAYSVGGMKDLIEPGVTGELASNLSADSLAGALEICLKRGKNSYFDSCRSSVLSKYDERILALKYEQLYLAQ